MNNNFPADPNKSIKIFGYEVIGSTLVPKENEVAVIKYIFQKQDEYSLNPPKDLVSAVLEDYAAIGEILTYEDAKKQGSI